MTVAIILVCVVLILWICIAWKRRRFYMFSWKVPGPNGLPFIGVAIRLRSLDGANIEPNLDVKMGTLGPGQDDLLYEFKKMADEYKQDTGFSWVGPYPFLATKDPLIIEKVLTSPDCLDKPRMYDNFVEALGGGLLTINSPECTTHRKMLNPAFKHSVLLSFFSIFNEGTDSLIQDMDRLVGKDASDISPYIYGCTLRISIETTMGLNGNEYRERSLKLLPSTQLVLKTTMKRLLMPWLRIESIFRLTSMYKPYKEAKEAVDQFVNEVLTEKIMSKENTQSCTATVESMENSIGDMSKDLDKKQSKNIFIDQALELYRNNHFDWNDFFGESSSMIYAAFETTATTINMGLIMLAMHPHYQERLYEEIVSTFPDKECFVNYDDFSKLVYLDMVISEVLRIAVTVPIISRHVNADLYVSKDLTIPKGMQVVIDIFNLHRNKKIWGPDAESFNPDNFLPENLADKHPYSYIPFSKGSRNCLGWHYAKMLLKVVLAKVIRNYRFTTKFPFEELHYVVNLTLKFKVIPQLEVHKR